MEKPGAGFGGIPKYTSGALTRSINSSSVQLPKAETVVSPS